MAFTALLLLHLLRVIFWSSTRRSHDISGAIHSDSGVTAERRAYVFMLPLTNFYRGDLTTPFASSCVAKKPLLGRGVV